MTMYNNDDCDHIISEFNAMLMCYTCGEVFEPLFKHSYDKNKHSLRKHTVFANKDSKRVKLYNKMMNQMFPDVFLPNGNIIMNDIEKRFDQLEENVGSFPSMKEVIHFILNKCEMTDLANTITLSKSKRSQNILEKLFED